MKLALTSHESIRPLTPNPAAPDSAMEVGGILRMLVRHLPLLALAAALSLGAAALYLVKTPRLYASTAVLEVKQRSRNILGPENGQAPSESSALEEQHTFEQSLTNRSLLVAVARDLKLDQDSRLFPEVGSPPPTDADIAKRFIPMVQAELRRGTRLVDLRATYFDAETAKRIADKVIELFVEQGTSKESGASLKTGSSLRREAERLRTKLAESEKELQRFREQNSGVPQDTGYNLFLERLKELNAQFSKARGTRLQLEADIAKMGQLPPGDSEALLQIGAIATLPEVAELQKIISTKRAEFSVIKEWSLPRHPRHVQANKELETLISARNAAIDSAASRVRTSYENAAEAETLLLTAIAEQEKSSLELSKQALPLSQLQNEVKADRELFEAVNRRLKETDLAAGYAVDGFRMSESPIVQPEPVSPQRTRILGLALIAGLVVGSAGAFGLEVFKRPSLVSEAEVPRPRDLPVLAEVPAERGDDFSLAIACANRRNTPECEAYRTLRASLRLLRPDREPRSILVTGASPDSGTAHCALNLAATFAGEGMRTLLIDVDFAGDGFEGILLQETGGPVVGLADGLAGGMAPSAFCHATKIPNLHLIPAGDPSGNPESLLSEQGFRDLLILAWNSLDRIIISAPPVPEMAEPMAPVRYGEAVCLTARSGKNARPQIWSAMERLDYPGHAPAGLVLNTSVPRFMPWLKGNGAGGGLFGNTNSVDEMSVPAI